MTTGLTFILTLEEMNLILSALADRPYGEVNELVANVRAQAERQLAERERSGGVLGHDREEWP